jgi:hypothetical protein
MRWGWAALWAIALALGTVIFVPEVRLAGLLAIGVLAAVAARKIGYCQHPGPLGLLPPVTNPDGTRTEAQWFCDQCGRSWPAAIASEQRLVRRFDGFDQTKAMDAARRAEDLRRRQQHLALRRAGLEPAKRPPSRLRPDAAEVVPISQVRHFVK